MKADAERLSRRAVVQLALLREEMAAIDYAGPRVAGARNYVVLHAPVDPYGDPIPDGEPKLELYIDTDDLERARLEAEAVYQAMRAEALLPPAIPRVLGSFWESGDWPLAEEFVDEAYDLMEQQRWGMAIVAAQVACEVEIRGVFERAGTNEPSDLGKLALRSLRFYTLMDRAGQQAFEAITGRKPTSAPCWSNYAAHVATRNNIVHRGAKVDRQSANQSIDAMHDMREWIQRVGQGLPDLPPSPPV